MASKASKLRLGATVRCFKPSNFSLYIFFYRIVISQPIWTAVAKSFSITESDVGVVVKLVSADSAPAASAGPQAALVYFPALGDERLSVS